MFAALSEGYVPNTPGYTRGSRVSSISDQSDFDVGTPRDTTINPSTDIELESQALDPEETSTKTSSSLSPNPYSNQQTSLLQRLHSFEPSSNHIKVTSNGVSHTVSSSHLMSIQSSDLGAPGNDCKALSSTYGHRDGDNESHSQKDKGLTPSVGRPKSAPNSAAPPSGSEGAIPQTLETSKNAMDLVHAVATRQNSELIFKAKKIDQLLLRGRNQLESTHIALRKVLDNYGISTIRRGIHSHADIRTTENQIMKEIKALKEQINIIDIQRENLKEPSMQVSPTSTTFAGTHSTHSAHTNLKVSNSPPLPEEHEQPHPTAALVLGHNINTTSKGPGNSTSSGSPSSTAPGPSVESKKRHGSPQTGPSSKKSKPPKVMLDELGSLEDEGAGLAAF